LDLILKNKMGYGEYVLQYSYEGSYLRQQSDLNVPP